MSGWIALPGRTTRHLFPGLGLFALCGVSRSVKHPGRPATDGDTECARCAAVIARRRTEARK